MECTIEVGWVLEGLQNGLFRGSEGHSTGKFMNADGLSVVGVGAGMCFG